NYFAATKSVTLVVTNSAMYFSDGFQQPVSLNRAFKQGSAVPIKWQVNDAAGNVVTSLAAIASLKVIGPNNSVTILYPGNTSDSGGTSLRNEGGQYIYNWQTKGIALGSYSLEAKFADGNKITQTIMLSTNGGAAGLVIDGVTASTAVGALL